MAKSSKTIEVKVERRVGKTKASSPYAPSPKF